MPDNILFSSHPANDLRNFIDSKKYSKVTVLTDDNTLKHCYAVVQSSLPAHEVVTVKSGEENKNLKTCEYIWNALTTQHLDRHSVVVVIGGGVLGDMGGFCAATYKRGIDFVLVPTTLLSQIDASIGGKLGVDFNSFKNHIGVFQVPALTLLYSGFLKTLSASEIRSGFAEIIKHTLISDETMWNVIKQKNLNDQNWDELVKHSVEFKARVTQEDPKEKGLRKILNAGHTIGHAIESYLLDNGRKIMHGEAIAAGMICENYISVKRGLLSMEAHQEITKYILSVFGKVSIASGEDNAVASLTLQDKKNKGNKIMCVLIRKPGDAGWDFEITPEEVREALSYYRSV
jgi:3-dehydroquinate synthase